MNGLLGLLDLDHFLVLVLGPRQRDVGGGGRVLHQRGWGQEVFGQVDTRDPTHHRRRRRHQPTLGRFVLDQVFVFHSNGDHRKLPHSFGNLIKHHFIDLI